jgi:hypothetical protein
LLRFYPAGGGVEDHAVVADNPAGLVVESEYRRDAVIVMGVYLGPGLPAIGAVIHERRCAANVYGADQPRFQFVDHKARHIAGYTRYVTIGPGVTAIGRFEYQAGWHQNPSGGIVQEPD